MDGCSGCHMSFLDLDERLIEVAEQVELVYGPLVDAKQFPDNVDVALVEGAVSSEEDLERIRLIRSKSKVLVSLGDCAVTGNVPSMRNPFEVAEVERRAYVENVTANPGVPQSIVPRLLPEVLPLHEVVPVDLFVPGCPPSADLIYYVLSEVLAGRTPELGAKCRFGA
jgi:NAD-reducing hydrogenase small subunit